MLLKAEPNNLIYQADYAHHLYQISGIQWLLGEYKNALASLDKGVAIRENLSAVTPNDAVNKSHLIAKLNFRLNFLLDEGRFEEALKNTEQIVKWFEEITARDTKDTTAKRGLGVAYN